MKRNLLITLIVVSFCSPAVWASERKSRVSSKIIQEKRLKVSFYFGAENGASDEQAFVAIQNFMEKNIGDLPGATIIKGRGYWDTGTQIASESSWVVIFLVPASDDVHARICSIAQQYAKEYKQHAVSWETQEVNYSRLVTVSH